MMKILTLLLVLLYCMQSKAYGHDIIAQNATNKDRKSSPDVFRQLLNQETIIRLSLTRNVQALMKDMLTLKKMLLSTRDELLNVKKEINNLREENNRLKETLSLHKKAFIESNTKFQKVNENFEQVRKHISDIAENQKRFELQVKANARYFETQTTNSLADLKTEIRLTSITLLNLEKHTQIVEKSLPILMDSRLRVMSSSVNKTIGNLSMDALKVYMADEVDNAVNEIKVDFLETQNQQLKIANSVSKLEMFRMNVSNKLIGKGHQVGFTAAITSDNSYWTGTWLTFPEVLSNIGGGYNPNDGIFTSPVSGNFVFHIAIVSYGSRYTEVSITVNEREKVRAKPMNGSSESGSNLLIIYLRKGDKVAVKRTGGRGYYSKSVPLMTFSGFKI